MAYQPRFRITPRLLELITQAAELRIWIASSVVDVPWLPRLQQETTARLAHSSTSIEGNPLTLPQVEALARGEFVQMSSTAKQEVLNYLAAMRWIWSQPQNAAIEEIRLLHLHKILTRKILPSEESGRYKTRPNRVVDHHGITVYTPPPPAQAASLTRALLAWINSPPAQELHAVLVSAVAHHRLVSIHPFKDGNGRIARALAIWLLFRRAFDTHHLFALDDFFDADRQRYYLKIQQARDLDDDLTDWLEYVAGGVVAALQNTRERIHSLQVSSKAPRTLLTRKQEEMLRFIRDKGRIRSPDAEKAFKLTRARVGQILKPLVRAGIVKQEGRRRGTTYRLR
jgi:Fic family protein